MCKGRLNSQLLALRSRDRIEPMAIMSASPGSAWTTFLPASISTMRGDRKSPKSCFPTWVAPSPRHQYSFIVISDSLITPGFMEIISFKSGRHGLTGLLLVEVCLSFCRGYIPNRAQQPLVVEPVNPFQGGDFHCFATAPGLPIDQLCFVQPVDGFSQSIVMAISFAAYIGLYAGLSETLGVSGGDVLATPVAMVYQAVHAARLSSVQRLLQGIQNEVCSHAVAHPPANDTPGKYIDHEGDVEPALPR